MTMKANLEGRACLTRLAACEDCKAACLPADDVNMMAECIQLDRACADADAFTVRLLMRGSNLQPAPAVCRMWAEA